MLKRRIMLVTPPYHAGVVEAAGRWPHLGFIYLAGHARDAGFETTIYDAMTKNHGYEEIRQRIIGINPDFVATSAYTASINEAVQVLRVAKEVNPKVITLLGGVHATFCYHELLSQHQGVIDFVILGEGEKTFPELLQAVQKGTDPGTVKGVAFRRGEEVVVTPSRPFSSCIDDFIPAWDLVDWDDYTFFILPGSRLAVVNSSRGCVNNCSFCSQQKFWQKSYRERQPENFVKELENLRDRFGVDIVMLSDEYPTRSRERWERILDLLLERRVGVKLLLETCAGDIVRDADIMPKYREAGVLHIYVGVEATNQERLDQFKKNLCCEQSREAIHLINQSGMISECSFVLGMPDETPASIETTLELARYYNPDFAHFLLIAPWPYADLFRDLQSYIMEWDYSKYNFVEPVVQPRAMSKEEISQAVIECYRRYYMDKLGDYMEEKNEFKRKYLISSLKVMLQNSFLHKHTAGLGEMPGEVSKLLSKEGFA